MNSLTNLFKLLGKRALNLFSLLTLIAFISCVGKVEDTKKKTANSEQKEDTVLELTLAKGFYPIAHDKIVARLEEPPAPYKMEDITYLISKTGDITPTAFSGAALETMIKDYTGSYQVVLDDLEMDTCYQFNVNIVSDNGDKTDSNEFFEACTLPNITSDFYGIGEVLPVSGLNGAYALKVTWSAATNTTDILPEPGDTYQYKVFVGKKSKIAPNQLFDEENSEVTAYSVDAKYNQAVVNGLTPDEEYWLGVRAYHNGFKSQIDNPFYYTEQNDFYLSGKTQSDALTNITWDQSSFTVRLDDGSSGLTSAIPSWDQVIGLFYNLRLYYVNKALVTDGTELWSHVMNDNDAACTGVETSDPRFICKNLTAGATTATIAGLTPRNDYWLAMAICFNEACTDVSKKIISPIIDFRTEPDIAFYGGIVSVLEPTDSDHLDRPRLSQTPIDTSTGAADGLVCKMQINAATEIYLNHPDPAIGPPDTRNTSDISILPFDFKEDYFITLSGVNIADSLNTYSFKCLPYIINGSDVEIYYDDILPWVSMNLALEGPTYAQFPGVETGFITCLDTNKSISATWPTPTGGIYNEYLLIIYDRSGGIFNIDNAYAQASGYTVIPVNKNLNSKTVYGMNNGTYDIAVATFLDYMTGTAYIYSSDNVEVGNCTISDP